MQLLDRYIIRQFLINFLILAFVLLSFFVLVDLIFNLDEFLEAGAARARAWAWAAESSGQGPPPEDYPEAGASARFIGTLYSVADFYGPLLLLVYVFMSGLIAVGAMGFTLSGLVRSREMTAMVVSGRSMHRVAAPILVAGCVLNALTLPDQELLIPRYADKLARSRAQVKMDAIETFSVQYAPDGAGDLFSAQSFDAQAGSLTNLTILDRPAQGVGLRRVTAAQAHWTDSGPDGKPGWELTNGHAIQRTVVDDQLTDAGPSDVEEVTFFPTDLSPDVLLARRAEIYPTLLSTAELNRLLDNPAADGRRITQIMHSRFSLMVVNVLVLVMGLPFFLLREPRNMLMQAVKAAGVCVGAWGGGIIMLQFQLGVLPPVVAAWLPVVIYLPVAAALLLAVKT